MSSQKALFREGSVPPGGTCLSSFVILTTGSDVLVGKMDKPDIWVERFFVGAQLAPTYYSSGKFLLPASHLAWYESPLEAAQRIVRDQVQLDTKQLKLLDVQSYLSGDRESTENPPHWDICFVYQAKVPKSLVKKIRKPEWFKEYGFVKRSKLEPDDFTRGHGDILQQAKLIGRRPRR